MKGHIEGLGTDRRETSDLETATEEERKERV